MDYHDFRYKFTDQESGKQILAALDVAGGPVKVLGLVRDGEGNITSYGTPGRAGFTYTDEETGRPVKVEPVGDPDAFYLAVRVTTDEPPFDPHTLNLMPVTAEESAAVVGVWA